MKKKIIIILLIMFLIIIIGLLLLKLSLINFWNKENNKFNYNKAKQIAVKYLNKNEEQLKTIAEELYESKGSKENPIKKIKFARYFRDFDFKGNGDYIKFNIDSQGALGGQYYGLLYTKDNYKNLIIYDGSKVQDGNNIFIKQKIKDNWYFYYDDYDGKVNIKKIK